MASMLAKSLTKVLIKLDNTGRYQQFDHISQHWENHNEAELLHNTATPYTHGVNNQHADEDVNKSTAL
eukprot:UN09747